MGDDKMKSFKELLEKQNSVRYFIDKNNNYLSYDGKNWKEALVSYHKDELVWKFKIKKGWAGIGRPEDKPNLKEIARPKTIQGYNVIG
jgi:hypothetical protein